MKRLIFTKEENSYSTQQFIARGNVIIGHVFNLDDKFLYSITDLNTGVILEFGTTKTLTSSKKEIKNKFKELGVVFYDEVRKKLEVM